MVNLTLKQSGTVVEQVGLVYFVAVDGRKVFIKVGDFLPSGLTLYSEKSIDFDDVHLVLDSITAPLFFIDDNAAAGVSAATSTSNSNAGQSLTNVHSDASAHAEPSSSAGWGLAKEATQKSNDDDNLESIFEEVESTAPAENEPKVEPEPSPSDSNSDEPFEPTEPTERAEPEPVIVVNHGVSLTAASITLDEDSETTALGVKLPIDPEGDPLTLFINSLPSALGMIKLANGESVKVGDRLTAEQFDGLTFTAAANVHGQGRLEYSVSDGTNNQSSYIDVSLQSINDVPTITLSNTSPLEETATVIGNISDLDGSILSSTVDALNGIVTIEDNGDISYTSNVNYNGDDTITLVIVDDGGATLNQTINLTVIAVNDAPIITVFDTAPVEDVTTIIGNINDIDGPLNIGASSYSALNGAVTIEANGDITYTSNADYSGVDTITLAIVDDSGATLNQTINLTVGAVNDAPVVTITNIAPLEDATTIIGNISDIDGLLNLGASSFSALNGAVTIEANGDISYSSNLNYNGVDTITLAIVDDSGATLNQTINLTVGAVNDAPVVIITNITPLEDATTIIGNISDIDGTLNLGASSYSALNGAVTIEANGDITYTSNADYSGVDTITLSIVDVGGASVSETINIMVDPVNDVPVITVTNTLVVEDVPTEIGVVSDADGISDLTSAGGSAVNGTVTIDALGKITYVSNANYHGNDTITLTVKDGDQTVVKTINLTVTPVNDVPLITVTNTLVVEDVPTEIGVVSDADGISDLTSASGSAVNGTVTIDAAGKITYVTNANYHGNDIITLTVKDGDETVVKTINLMVSSVNDAPVPAIHNVVFDEGIGQVDLVMPAATDAEGDILTYSITGLPDSLGSIKLSDGRVVNLGDNLTEAEFTGLTFTATATGNATLNYNVADGTALAVAGTVNVQVNPLNFIEQVSLAANGDFVVSGLVDKLAASYKLFITDGISTQVVDINPVDRLFSTSFTRLGSGVGGPFIIYVSGVDGSDNPVGIGSNKINYYLDDNDITAQSASDLSIVDGFASNDTLFGGSGNDLLLAGAGNDTLNSGAGDDVFLVEAGGGFDDYTAGLGTDIIYAVADNVVIGIKEHFKSDDSVETISATYNGVTYQNVTIETDGGWNTLDFSNTKLENIVAIIGGDSLDKITGSTGDDTIIGGKGRDTLAGNSGDDNFLIGLGDDFDIFDGGLGTNSIYATADGTAIGFYSSFNPADNIQTISATYNGTSYSNVTIAGGDGDNNLDFSATTFIGIDTIDAGAGYDKVTGTTQADIIIGGTDRDTLSGAGGDDVFLVGLSDGFDVFDGGSGTNSIYATADGTTIGFYSSFNSADNIQTISATYNGTSYNNVTLAGSDGWNTLDFSATTFIGIDTIDAGAGHDNITGSIGDDIIKGGLDRNVLRGNDGNDRLIVTDDSDKDDIWGDAGVDTAVFSGAYSDYTLDFSNSAYVVVTQDASTDVVAWVHDSTEFIEFNDKTIALTPVITEVQIGTESDYVLSGIAKLSTTNIKLYILNSGGTEVFASALADATIDVDGNYTINFDKISGFGTGEFSIYTQETDGSGNPVGRASTNISHYIGTFNPDTYTAPDNITLVVGNNGNDIINGSAYNDILSGDSSVDKLYGNGGDDVLFGGSGRDTLEGGLGDDTFLVDINSSYDYFRGGDGYDQILAIENNSQIGFQYTDTALQSIELISANGYSGVTIEGDSSDQKLDFTNVILDGIIAINGNNNRDQITGSAGNDVINGGNDDDTLVGGAGDDTFLVDTGAGFDRIDGGLGIDQILATANNVGIGFNYTQSGGLSALQNVEIISANGFSGVTIEGNNNDQLLDFSNVTLIGITSINGNNGHDNITGSAGDDVISGGIWGNDLHGHDGDDRFIITDDSYKDDIWGDAGLDTAVFSGAYSDYSLDFSDPNYVVVTNISSGNISAWVHNSTEFLAFSDTTISLTPTITTLSAGSTKDIKISGTMLPTVIRLNAYIYDSVGTKIATILSTEFSYLLGSFSVEIDKLIGATDVSSIVIQQVDISDNPIGTPSQAIEYFVDSSANYVDFSSNQVMTIIDSLDRDDILVGSKYDDLVFNGSNKDIIMTGQGNDTVLFSVGSTWDFNTIFGGSRWQLSPDNELNKLVATIDGTRFGLDDFYFGPRNGIDEIDGNGYSGVSIYREISNFYLDFSTVTLNDIALIKPNTSSASSTFALIVGSTNDDTIELNRLLFASAVMGNEGSDTFIVDKSSYINVYGGMGLNDINDGVADLDTLVPFENSQGISFQWDFSIANGIETIDATGFSDIGIYGSNHFNVLDFRGVILTNIDYIRGASDNLTGDNIIVGSYAADTIRPTGYNEDILAGSLGADTFLVAENSHNTFFGGEGLNDIEDSFNDTIVAGSENTKIGFDLDFTPEHGIEFIDGLAFGGVFIAGGGSHNLFDFSQTTLTNIQWIEGGGGQDIIIGGASDDVIIGGSSSDKLAAGQGNDTLTGGNSYEQYIWLAGDQGTVATPAIDTITDFSVKFDKLDLSDLLVGHSMINITDYLKFVDGTTNLELHISIDGNLATNQIQQKIVFGNYANMAAVVADPLYSGTVADSVSLLANLVGTGYGKIIIDSGMSYDVLSNRFFDGTDDTDNIIDTASISSAAIYGYGGDDIFEISATTGTKRYYGDHDVNFDRSQDDQFDQIKAVESNIDIRLGAFFSSIHGIEEITAIGQDNVTIGTDSNGSSSHIWDFSDVTLTNISVIYGSAKTDRITGSVGDDTIEGGNGLWGSEPDILAGHDGNDTFLVGVNDGYGVFYGGNGLLDSRDTFYDQIVAIQANTAIGLYGHFSDGNGIEEISAGNDLSGNAWTNVTIEGGTKTEYLDFSTVKLTDISAINANDHNDFVIGSTGDDTINGGNGHDDLLGHDGDDTINGDADNDTLQGNAGNDTLAGGVGDDTLYGDSGNDILTGGVGNDLFIWGKGDAGFESMPEIDHISDFEIADTLDLSGLLLGETNTNINNYLSFSLEDSHLVMNVVSDGVLGHQADLQIHFDNYSDQNALFAALPGSNIDLLADLLISNLVIDT